MFPMSADASASGPSSLRGYVASVRRHAVLAIVIVVGVVALAAVYTLRQPDEYRSSVTLAVRSPLDVSQVSQDRSVDADRSLRNEVEFIASDMMDKEVDKVLDRRASIRVEASDDSDVLVITASGPEPQVVADTANAYAETYRSLRLTEVVRSTEETAAKVESSLDDVTTQLNELNKPVNDLDLRIAVTPPGPELDALQQQRSSLVSGTQRQLESLLGQQSAFRTQLATLSLRMESIRSEGIRTLQEASVPSEPIGTGLKTNLVLATVVGILLALAVVLLVDYFDDRITSKDAMERVVAPILGMIPTVPGWREKDDPRVVSIDDPTSPESEAFRSLRTSVKFLGMQQSLRIVQVTSPMAREGKSATVANLAVALARAGDRVLVVSGDLRRPRIEHFFGVADVDVGITSVLLGDATFGEVVQEVADVRNLYVLGTGQLPPNPSELLEWIRTRETIERIAAGFDIVLVDSPPVLPVTDALVTARFCDATIVVARSRQTSRRRLQRCVEMLRLVEANVIGGVLTEANSRDEYSSYEYDYKPVDRRKPKSRLREGEAASRSITAS